MTGSAGHSIAGSSHIDVFSVALSVAIGFECEAKLNSQGREQVEKAL